MDRRETELRSSLHEKVGIQSNLGHSSPTGGFKVESPAHEAEATTDEDEKTHPAYMTNYQLQNELCN